MICPPQTVQLRISSILTKQPLSSLGGTKAAHIKEAYLSAFNHIASQLQSAIPTLPPSQYQLPASCLPNFYDSGWLPAHY
ncbi:hypothetical protein AB6D25_05010 [Vibrio cyclitrophicus]